nr:hypothetical protein [Tanacetum cinerariifolium]
MASFADKAILMGADNLPPMLEKDMYDTWRSRMELYMLNRQHGKMILKSVEHGPLLWPSVTEDEVTRLKEYSKLSSAEAIQADCDVKETNIILQALPLEIYALVNTHKDALDSAADGNFLDKIPRECLSIIESKSKVRYSRSRVTNVRTNVNAPLSFSSHSNSFDLQQIAAALEDKLDIRMNRFEKS